MGHFEKEKIMTKENIKTNTSLRYSQYRKRLSHTFSFKKLKKQIETLHDQEFIINVPIGGVADGSKNRTGSNSYGGTATTL